MWGYARKAVVCGRRSWGRSHEPRSQCSPRPRRRRSWRPAPRTRRRTPSFQGGCRGCRCSWTGQRSRTPSAGRPACVGAWVRACSRGGARGAAEGAGAVTHPRKPIGVDGGVAGLCLLQQEPLITTVKVLRPGVVHVRALGAVGGLCTAIAWVKSDG